MPTSLRLTLLMTLTVIYLVFVSSLPYFHEFFPFSVSSPFSVVDVDDIDGEPRPSTSTGIVHFYKKQL